MRFHLLFWGMGIRLGLAMAIALTVRPASARPFQEDPIPVLRQVLDQETSKPYEDREKAILNVIQGIHRIGDLARALQLQEWKTEVLDPDLAAVDLKMRGEVANLFEKSVSSVFARNQPLATLAVINLLSEIAISERSGNNPSPVVRDALSRFVPQLAQMTSLKNAKAPQVCLAAARALGIIEAPLERAIPALQAMLSQDNPVILRRAAAQALNDRVGLLKAGERQGIVVIRNINEEEVVKVGRVVVPVAAGGLSDPDLQVQRICIEAIQQVTSAMVSPLEQSGTESLPLGTMPKPEEIRRALEEHKERITKQVQTVEPLLVIFGKNINTLIEAIANPQPSVRLTALRIMEDLGKVRLTLRQRSESIPPPQPIPESNPSDKQSLLPEENITRIVWHQARYERPQVEKLLREELQKARLAITTALQDPDPHVRLAAAEALEMLGVDAVASISALTTSLRDNYVFVRWVAARTLGKLAPAKPDIGVRGLIDVLMDPDLDVRIMGAAALKRYGPAAKDAVPALAQAVGRGDGVFRVAAIHALEGIGTAAAPAIPALARALADENPRVRQTAAEALGLFGPQAVSARYALERALDDVEPDVRRAASDAMLSVLRP